METKTSSSLFQSKSIPRFLLIGALLLSAFALIIIPPIQYAHAANPAFDTQTNGEFAATNTGTTHNAVAPANAGELIVVSISTSDNSVAVCGSERTVSSITDSTGGVTFTELSGGPQCSTTGAHVGIADIWYGLTSSVAAQTVTITMSGSTNSVWFTASFFTLKTANIVSKATGSCQNGGGCAGVATTSTLAGYTTGDIVVGTATSSSGDMSSAGSGFTALNYYNGVANVASCAADAVANFCFQYIVPSSGAGQTNFPANLQVGNRDYSDIGVVFGPSSNSLPIGGSCSSVTSCTTLGFNVTANSGVVVAVEWNSSKTTVSSVIDSLGHTYTQAQTYFGCTNVTTCSAGNVVSSGIWYLTTASAFTAITVTITFSASTNSVGYQVYDLSGVTGVACTGFGSTGGTNLQIFGPNYCPILTGQYGIAALGGLAKNTLTAGANFALTSSPDVNFAAQESTTGTGQTAFPATISAATPNVDVGVVFSITPSTGTINLGSCPTKNTATTTLANNTQYFWTGTVISGMSINTISAEVASVNSGHVASETLYFAFYATGSAGGISATNPLLLGGFKTWTLSATSVPQLLSWASSVTLNTPSGGTWAISLLGNSKIVINQSSLSGMFTGASAAGPLPAVTFTSLSANAAQLYFCANGTFQTVVTTTIVSTSTITTGGGTATVTTTTTSTATSIDAATAATTSIGAALLIIIILLPAVLLTFALGVTTKSPSAAGMGFVAGLTIGTAIGNRAGLVPFYLVAIMVVVMIFIIIGLLLFSRAQG